jgi:hypothetical protein
MIMKKTYLLLTFSVFINGTIMAQNIFPATGDTKISGNNVIEWGQDIVKEVSAGKIAYQKFSDALDIVGAGTTVSNRKLKFWAEGGAFFTGGVGIGTTVAYPWEPSKGLFEVRNGSILGSTPGSYQLLTCTSQASGTNYFQNNVWALRDNSGGNDWFTTRLHDAISIDGSFLTPGVDTRTWWERAPFKDIQSFGTGKTAYLTINSSNVGIGTTTPTDKLEVNGNINVGINSGAATGLGNKVNFNGLDDSNSLDPMWLARYNVGPNQTELRMNIGDDSIGDDAFTVGNYFHVDGQWKTFFKILNNGSVGIGTTTPDSKLAVNGTIHSKEVKVDLIGWPDYVFEPTYNLKPLSEIETYIKENKHLPEVPSAKEVEKNGVLLGEMNKLLLKKVEELTLYMIEFKKRDELLQNRIDLQEKEIENLKKK